MPFHFITGKPITPSQRHPRNYAWMLFQILIVSGILSLVHSCARMGSPDGGWYDEKPPKVVSASPADRGVNADSKRVVINFDEFIKLEGATEKVVISPPQMEQPEIKAQGRRILIQLKDSLKPNTTYTIDFSDAISDNNENNPMGNYTYSFSTGPQIDTLEVSGYVLNAEDLEPVKGILVGLGNYEPAPETSDEFALTSAPQTPLLSLHSSPLLRVSRTDSRGHFVIRGIAPGEYVVGALEDMDGDYTFSQRAEKMAFSHRVVVPRCYPDTRQDTIWADEIHIRDIERIPYTHFVPDDIVLRSFAHDNTNRYYTKSERTEPERFSLYFSAPLSLDSINAYNERMSSPSRKRTSFRHDFTPLPTLRALDFDIAALHVEPSIKGDTVTYWLRDTALVNRDTLTIEMTTLATDTLGMLQPFVDTLTILAKTPYAKRLKAQQKKDEEWQKSVEKKRKRLKEGQLLTAADTIMPPKRLMVEYKFDMSMSPDGSVFFNFPTPMQRIDTTAVHLYVEQDSLWFRAPFVFEPRPHSTLLPDSLPRTWELYTEWIPDARYSLEIDTLAFEDIYGVTSDPYKTGIQVRSLDQYSTLFVNLSGIPAFPAENASAVSSASGSSASIASPATVPGTSASGSSASIASPATVPGASASGSSATPPSVIVQLLDRSDNPVHQSIAENGTAEFYYLAPGTYYMRAIIDRNGNGRWDAGEYYIDRQPEEVFYYPEEVECRAKWDITKQWNLALKPLNEQKPPAITKQKGEAQKKRRNRNEQRARDKGIPLPDYLK